MAEATLRILALSHHGHGVAEWRGQRVLVPRTDKGELVRVTLHQRQRGRLVGQVREILEASVHHGIASCPQAADCPGCPLIHLTPRRQAEHKLQALQRALKRLADLPDPPLAPLLTAQPAMGYRQRTTLRYLTGNGLPVLGIPGHPWSGKPVSLEDCPLHAPALSTLVSSVAQQLRRARVTPDDLTGVRAWSGGPVLLRTTRWPSFTMGRIGLALQPPDLSVGLEGPGIPPQLKPLRGKTELRFNLSGRTHRAGITAWTPVSLDGARLLTETLTAILEPEPNSRILELGCGVGSASLPLAARGATVLGLDISREAVAYAQLNATACGFTNANYQVGRARDAPRKLASVGRLFERLLLHGMRNPFGPEVLSRLSVTGASRMALVMPAPASLARDLKVLLAQDWILRRIYPIDQLPGTHHLLCVALLFRRTSAKSKTEG